MLHKNISLDDIGFKFADSGMKFSGYASVFNSVDSYGDTIQAGAYSNTLKNRTRPIRMRWNHYGDVIGKWTHIEEDEKGLFVKGELTPNHSKAADVYASMKHGAVDGMSIGYRPIAAQKQEDGTTLLKEIELIEISVVEEPADLHATVADVKSAIEECKSVREIEELLRDVCKFSGLDAKTLVSRIKSMCRRDVEAEIKARQEILDSFAKY